MFLKAYKETSTQQREQRITFSSQVNHVFNNDYSNKYSYAILSFYLSSIRTRTNYLYIIYIRLFSSFQQFFSHLSLGQITNFLSSKYFGKNAWHWSSSCGLLVHVLLLVFFISVLLYCLKKLHGSLFSSHVKLMWKAQDMNDWINKYIKHKDWYFMKYAS